MLWHEIIQNSNSSGHKQSHRAWLFMYWLGLLLHYTSGMTVKAQYICSLALQRVCWLLPQLTVHAPRMRQVSDPLGAEKTSQHYLRVLRNWGKSVQNQLEHQTQCCSFPAVSWTWPEPSVQNLSPAFLLVQDAFPKYPMLASLLFPSLSSNGIFSVRPPPKTLLTTALHSHPPSCLSVNTSWLSSQILDCWWHNVSSWEAGIVVCFPHHCIPSTQNSAWYHGSCWKKKAYWR